MQLSRQWFCKLSECFPKGLGFLPLPHVLRELVSRRFLRQIRELHYTPISVARQEARLRLQTHVGCRSSASHGHCRTKTCQTHRGAPVLCKNTTRHQNGPQTMRQKSRTPCDPKSHNSACKDNPRHPPRLNHCDVTKTEILYTKRYLRRWQACILRNNFIDVIPHKGRVAVPAGVKKGRRRRQ